MRWTLSLLLALAVLSFAPLARAEGPNPREHLIHLPGIAGARALDRYFLKGVQDGGYRGAIEVIDWPGAEPGLKALVNRQRHEREADRVAARIEKLFTDDPELKIRLVGHSGGSGIAAWALERLPKGLQVESVVLVAPALSQQYDLSRALSHVRGRAYAFTSPNDVIILGVGTSMFGTIDGVKQEASGLRGFTRPAGADAAQYAKLVPMDYLPDWMELGNLGDHVGPMGRTFAAQVISPILQDRPPVTTRPTTTNSTTKRPATPTPPEKSVTQSTDNAPAAKQ